MKSNMTFSYESKPIFTLNNEINNSGRQGGINLQPSYQRGYVWNTDFKNKLVYSIIRQFPIGNITVKVNNGIREVVDGQQRLTTINDFVNDKLYVSCKYAKEIIKFISQYLIDEEEDPDLRKLVKKLGNKTGVKFRFSNLPNDIKNNVLAYNVSLTSIANDQDDEIIEYFQFLQNQERLRASEIINSFPSTDLEHFRDGINDLDSFLEKIGFKSNKRHDFDKHFYSIIGLLAKKINYGVTDKKVIDFAKKVKLPLTN